MALRDPACIPSILELYFINTRPLLKRVSGSQPISSPECLLSVYFSLLLYYLGASVMAIFMSGAHRTVPGRSPDVRQDWGARARDKMLPSLDISDVFDKHRGAVPARSHIFSSSSPQCQYTGESNPAPAFETSHPSYPSKYKTASATQ